jgi:ribosomal protein L14E/L6E/L27E
MTMEILGGFTGIAGICVTSETNYFVCLQVRKTLRPAKVRETLVPGTILILLAGRFRGKRVILLKSLDQGVLLVTGPFKINGVPLRRVNARYVIATSKRVDISGVDAKAVEKISAPGYFTKDKKAEKKTEEAFFKQGEKAEVRILSKKSHFQGSNANYFFFIFTEEGCCQRSRQRPEGCRPGHPCLHQEGGLPRQLPRYHLQPPKRRQAPRDEVVNMW